jgi:hypothetical protein
MMQVWPERTVESEVRDNDDRFVRAARTSGTKKREEDETKATYAHAI